MQEKNAMKSMNYLKAVVSWLDAMAWRINRVRHFFRRLTEMGSGTDPSAHLVVFFVSKGFM